MTALLLTAGVFLLLALRIPIAFAFLGPSLVYLALTPELTLLTAVQRMISALDSFILVAVPLFILMGNIMNAADITNRIFDFVECMVGRVRGSLAYVNVGASALFAGMSGSAVADAAGLGQVEIAAMARAGYDKKFSAGITAASSIIGPIIPPSIVAVVYGATAGVSIGGLFLGGVGPGLIIAVALSLMIYVEAKRRNFPRSEKADWRKKLVAAARALPALLTPIVLMGGIVFGFFTPTESATVAVLYAAVIGGFVYRSLDMNSLYASMVATARTTGSVLLIVATASLYGWILTREGAPQELYEVLIGLTENPIVFLLLVNVLLLLIGMIMEPIPSILILVPIVVPVATAMGIDPIHFGIVCIVNLTIGMVTPPVGNVLYALNSVTDMSFGDIVRGVAPFYLPLIIALLIVTYVPWITLALPWAFGFY